MKKYQVVLSFMLAAAVWLAGFLPAGGFARAAEETELADTAEPGATEAGPAITLLPHREAEGFISFSLCFLHCVGLTSADVKMTYDPDALEFVEAQEGADAAQVNKTASNEFLWGANGAKPGQVSACLVFKMALRSAAQFAADAASPETDPVEVNDGAFEACVFRFRIKDADAGHIDAALEPVFVFGIEAVGDGVRVCLHKNDTRSVIAQPTCGEAGRAACVCDICGDAVYEELPATGAHTWNAGEVTKAPTASAEGETTYTCTVCGLQRTEPIEKLSYTPGDVDADGAVTASDARLALRRAVHLEDFEETSPAYLACDIDGDCEVTSSDARTILRIAVGLKDEE